MASSIATAMVRRWSPRERLQHYRGPVKAPIFPLMNAKWMEVIPAPSDFYQRLLVCPFIQLYCFVMTSISG
jgi:hypothetical protein